MADPIAENQTENVIALLLTGKATIEQRDQATAALLSGLQKLGDTVAEIKRELWKPDDLTRFFEEQHQKKCQECPARKMADKADAADKADSGWKEVALTLLKYGGWILLIISSVFGVKINP